MWSFLRSLATGFPLKANRRGFGIEDLEARLALSSAPAIPPVDPDASVVGEPLQPDRNLIGAMNDAALSAVDHGAAQSFGGDNPSNHEVDELWLRALEEEFPEDAEPLTEFDDGWDEAGIEPIRAIEAEDESHEEALFEQVSVADDAPIYDEDELWTRALAEGFIAKDDPIDEFDEVSDALFLSSSIPLEVEMVLEEEAEYALPTEVSGIEPDVDTVDELWTRALSDETPDPRDPVAELKEIHDEALLGALASMDILDDADDVDGDARLVDMLAESTIQLLARSVEVDESADAVVFAVTLSEASARTFTVDYATRDQSAVAGKDYVAASGTLVFAPGEIVKTIEVELIDDNVYERSLERFLLDLSNNSHGWIVTPTVAGKIRDDDPVPVVSISDASVEEGRSRRTFVEFTLTLSAPSDVKAVVYATTVGLTAKSGRDFLGVSKPVAFQPGATTAVLAVRVFSDRIDETDETFRVNLRQGRHALADAQHAIGTILDRGGSIPPGDEDETVPGGDGHGGGSVDSDPDDEEAPPSPNPGSPPGPPPVVDSRYPADGGMTLYYYAYDSQPRIDAHWHSAGGAAAPTVASDSTGSFLRWTIDDSEEFGRLPSERIAIPQTGIVDVDVLMRIPQSWIDLGRLPETPANPGDDYKTFSTMKLFRLFPAGSGHNATIFGRMGTGEIYLRDFDDDKLSPLTSYSITPDQWMMIRIRYDYSAGTVGLWVEKNGSFVEIGTVPGGGELTTRVGPIFHASTRDAEHGYGNHNPTYVDFHSYRVIHRG